MDRKSADNYLKKRKFFYDSPIVTFGAFSDSPIEWKILSVSGGHFLLISKDIITRKQIHTTSDSSTSWKNCSLRQWLNDDFLNGSFDEEERAIIDSVETERGCEDRVFLLSQEEVMDTDLFRDNSARKASGKYWLRTITGYGDRAVLVDTTGYTDWAYNDNSEIGVRPVFWVDLN